MNIEERVKKTISKEHASYQSAEKLCFMGWVGLGDQPYPPKGFDSEDAWFLNKRCGDIVFGTFSICEFERKYV